jgi:hypothetical protein
VLKLHIAMIAALTFGINASAAEDVELMALEAFYGTCLSQGPDIERTKLAAALLKWKPLPPNLLARLAPARTPDAYEGWKVSSEGYPKKTVVAVTKGRVGGQTIENCTMAVIGIDPDRLEALFIGRFSPAKVGDSDDGMKRYRSYRATLGLQEREQLIIITTPISQMPEPVVVISTSMAR